MSRKSEVINLLTKINESYIERNTINIYTLLATIEKIEDRVYKKVS